MVLISEVSLKQLKKSDDVATTERTAGYLQNFVREFVLKYLIIIN